MLYAVFTACSWGPSRHCGQVVASVAAPDGFGNMGSNLHASDDRVNCRQLFRQVDATSTLSNFLPSSFEAFALMYCELVGCHTFA